MKKTFSFFLLSCLIGVGVCNAAGPAIIGDFSSVSRNDNGNWQQGWTVNGIVNKFAEAKYLVIETQGEGNNAGGFGGIDLIFQGGGPSGDIGWKQVGLNSGGWTSFPRATGKTVSIAVDIKAVLGSDYNVFIDCVWWCNFFLQYAYGTSFTAFEGLGLQQVYLTEDFAKPASAVNLDGSYGFIFEGSVAPPKKITSIIDFEDDALSTSYPIVGWGPGDVSAIVVADPDPAGANGQSLHVVATNWNSGFRINEITLPAGKTLGDVEKITANIYFATGGDMNWKSLQFWFGTVGASFSPTAPTGEIGNNIIGSETRLTWITKEFAASKMGLTGSLLDLNKFDMGIGMNASNFDFYWDNITFVFKSDLVIPAGEEVTITKASFDGNVIFQANDEEGTGQLIIDNGTGVLAVTGKVILEKEISKHGAGAGEHAGNRKWYAIGFPFGIASIQCSLPGAEGISLDAGDDFWLSVIGEDGEFGEIKEEVIGTGTTLIANQGYAIQFPDVLEGEIVTFISGRGVTLNNASNIAIPATDVYAMVTNPAVINIVPSCPGAKQHTYPFDGFVSFLHDHGATKTLQPFEALVVYEENLIAPKKSIVCVEGGATGLISLDAGKDEIADVRYYNLQGVEVFKPTVAGVYIVKTIYKSNNVVTSKQLIK